ncbi:hypothetical protein ACHWQZ_G007629 [Mnemiopsis leidyi]
MPGLLLILHFLVPVRGLVISQSGVKLKPDKHNIVEYKINKKAFGFQKKATVNVTVTCEENLRRDLDSKTGKSLALFRCPAGIPEIDPVDYSNSCSNIGVKSHSAKEIRYFGSVDNEEFATLILKEKDYDRELTVRVCSINAIFLNQGSHLSTDQIPIPTNFIVTLVVWMVLSFLWLVNALCFRKHSNNLHRLLSALLMIKLVNLILAYIFWKELDGRGRWSLQISLPYVLCTSVFETMIFIVLMLAGEGWCIIWENPRLLKYYLILSSSFFLMVLCYKFVHKYFQGFAIVFASMMIYIAFKCSTISINTVKRNITASNQFIDNHRLTYKSDITLKKRLNKKLRMFNYLQGLIIGLPCVLIVVESVASFLLVYNEWTRILLKELLELSVMIYCCALFRLRNFTDYNNISINTPYHNNVVLLTPYKNIVYISCERDSQDTAESDHT